MSIVVLKKWSDLLKRFANRSLKNPHRTGRAPVRFEPRLEPLEDRRLLTCQSPDAFICTPLPQEGQVVHIHPHLTITINGQQQEIPANTGIGTDSMGRPTFLPIHTHDNTGTIHVESPIQRDFHLKDFFDVWGQTFTNQQIMGSVGLVTMTHTVNGQTSPSTEFGSLLLQDKDDIRISVDGAVSATSLNAAAKIFAHSREHYTDFVTKAYQKYLGRGPDTGGLNAWVDAMQNHGLTDEQLEANFISSPEFIQNQGGTASGWITGMYKTLLGRTPSQSEIDTWMHVLQSGATNYQVAFGFAASQEREAARVRDNYTTYLNRSASQQEVDLFVGLLQQAHMTNEDIAAIFVGSPEYFDNPQRGKGQKTAWITSAYQQVLFRTPSQSEINTWLAFLG
jgi:hypothetical protein